MSDCCGDNNIPEEKNIEKKNNSNKSSKSFLGKLLNNSGKNDSRKEVQNSEQEGGCC